MDLSTAALAVARGQAAGGGGVSRRDNVQESEWDDLASQTARKTKLAVLCVGEVVGRASALDGNRPSVGGYGWW